MALTVNTYDTVKFGEIEELPKITAEIRLRLDTLKFKTAEDVERAREVLASAFPVHKAEILAFLSSEENPVPVFELMRIQAYLQGGDAALEACDGAFSATIDKLVEKSNA